MTQKEIQKEQKGETQGPVAPSHPAFSPLTEENCT